MEGGECCWLPRWDSEGLPTAVGYTSPVERHRPVQQFGLVGFVVVWVLGAKGPCLGRTPAGISMHVGRILFAGAGRLAMCGLVVAVLASSAAVRPGPTWWAVAGCGSLCFPHDVCGWLRSAGSLVVAAPVVVLLAV